MCGVYVWSILGRLIEGVSKQGGGGGDDEE